MKGVVYLVGAGPGAADLLTVRAARLLAGAEIVIHDALVGPDILALATQARRINVGKRAHRPSTDQAVINRLLVQAAERARVVVRLKGGDPSLFARAQEEIEACRRAGVAVEIVPGVTAACAAAGDLGIALTQRGLSRSVVFVTPAAAKGAREDRAWADAAAAADTAVVYMGRGEAGRVRDALLARGKAPRLPVAVAADVSNPDSVHAVGVLGDLPILAAAAGDAPTLLIIGAVAGSAAVTERAPERISA
jgi:uroporphyrin-III C-methyltransferase